MQLTNQINNTNNWPTLINSYANEGYVFFLFFWNAPYLHTYMNHNRKRTIFLKKMSNSCISIIFKKNCHNDSFTFCKYIRIFRLNYELLLTLPQLLGLFYAHIKELNFGHGPLHARVAITNAIIIGFSMVRISNSISSIHLLVWKKVLTFHIKSEQINIPIERY